MHSSVAKDESDGDADDESPSTRPTKQPSATTTLSLTLILKGWTRTTRQLYVSSTEDEFLPAQTMHTFSIHPGRSKGEQDVTILNINSEYN
jgi:hypothetical protein